MTYCDVYASGAVNNVWQHGINGTAVAKLFTHCQYEIGNVHLTEPSDLQIIIRIIGCNVNANKLRHKQAFAARIYNLQIVIIL